MRSCDVQVNADGKSASVERRDEGGLEHGTVHVMLDAPFRQNGIDRRLMVTSVLYEGNDCHSCALDIDAIQWKNERDFWIPEIIDRHALDFGARGDAGTAKLVQYRKDLYGFSLELPDTHQGEADISLQLVAPVQGHFRPVLLVSKESDNGGNCGGDASGGPCYANSSSVLFLASGGVLPDIEIDEKGDDLNDHGAVLSANRKIIYTFSGDHYQQVGH